MLNNVCFKRICVELLSSSTALNGSCYMQKTTLCFTGRFTLYKPLETFNEARSIIVFHADTFLEYPLMQGLI